MAVRKPSPAIMAALRDFVFRHEIFVEASEFDDGFLFSRQLRRRSKRLKPRRHFEVFLRRNGRRVKFFTVMCGSEDLDGSKISIDFPERVLLRPSEAAIEYERCGRDAKRYAAQFAKDPDAARALFGYVRSESRLLMKLLGGSRYKELLRLVRRHRRAAPAPVAHRRSSRRRQGRPS
jgi:hypothetical protein